MEEISTSWPNDSIKTYFTPFYFFILTISCSFLLLNIIVGVIIDEYSKQKEKHISLMSKKDRTEWLERKILTAMHPIQLMDRPSGK